MYIKFTILSVFKYILIVVQASYHPSLELPQRPTLKLCTHWTITPHDPLPPAPAGHHSVYFSF